MEYVLKAYQFLKCFSDDGTPQKMPFSFIDPEHENALPSMQSCLGMKSKKEIGNCLDVCNAFDYVHYSPVFDGERKFIHQVINFILGVVRTHGFQYNRILEADRPGSKIKQRKLSVESLYAGEENEFGEFDDAYIDDDYFRHSRYLSDQKDEKKDDAKKDDAKTDEEKKKEEEEKKKEEENGDKPKTKAISKPGEKAPEEEKKPDASKPLTIYEILKTIGKSKRYSRPKYHEFNEERHSHRTYNVTAPNIDFTKMVYMVEDTGLNPIAIYKGSNFDMSVAHLLIGHAAGNHENLNRFVVRALVGIEAEDIKYFNTELEKPVSETIPQDPEEAKKKEVAENEQKVKDAKAEAAKPKVPEKPKEGEGEAGDGAQVASGSDTKQPRQLYGKLYHKLYKKTKHRKNRKSYHRHSSPLMKAMIELLF
jgi:hypothetical protein